MTTVSMFEAKTNLSKYVASLMERREPYIVITKNGKPVAKLISYEAPTARRLGVAKGKLPELDSLDVFNSIDAGEEFEMKETL